MTKLPPPPDEEEFLADVKPHQVEPLRALLAAISDLERRRYNGGQCPPEDWAALTVEACEKYIRQRLNEKIKTLKR